MFLRAPLGRFQHAAFETGCSFRRALMFLAVLTTLNSLHICS